MQDHAYRVLMIAGILIVAVLLVVMLASRYNRPTVQVRLCEYRDGGLDFDLQIHAPWNANATIGIPRFLNQDTLWKLNCVECANESGGGSCLIGIINFTDTSEQGITELTVPVYRTPEINYQVRVSINNDTLKTDAAAAIHAEISRDKTMDGSPVGRVRHAGLAWADQLAYGIRHGEYTLEEAARIELLIKDLRSGIRVNQLRLYMVRWIRGDAEDKNGAWIGYVDLAKTVSYVRVREYDNEGHKRVQEDYESVYLSASALYSVEPILPFRVRTGDQRKDDKAWKQFAASWPSDDKMPVMWLSLPSKTVKTTIALVDKDGNESEELPLRLWSYSGKGNATTAPEVAASQTSGTTTKPTSKQ